MLRNVLICLTVLASFTPGFSAWSQGITNVESSPESIVIDFSEDPADVQPSVLLLSTFSLDPTTITFTTDLQPFSRTIVLAQTNNTSVFWDGLEFELSGGTFASPPFVFGGDTGIIIGNEFKRAQLISPVQGAIFVDLPLSFDAESPVLLTVTPIVPEPASLVLFGATAVLLLRSRATG